MAEYLGRELPAGNTLADSPAKHRLEDLPPCTIQNHARFAAISTVIAFWSRPEIPTPPPSTRPLRKATVTNGAVTINMGAVVANGVKAYASLA